MEPLSKAETALGLFSCIHKKEQKNFPWQFLNWKGALANRKAECSLYRKSREEFWGDLWTTWLISRLLLARDNMAGFCASLWVFLSLFSEFPLQTVSYEVD